MIEKKNKKNKFHSNKVIQNPLNSFLNYKFFIFVKWMIYNNIKQINMKYKCINKLNKLLLVFLFEPFFVFVLFYK